MILYNLIEDRERFYKISIQKSLFNTYILERIYGSTSYSKPVGVVSKEYDDYISARLEYVKIVKRKIRKGYIEKV